MPITKETANAAAKLFANQKILVTVPKTDRKGYVKELNTGRYVTEQLSLGAEHILDVVEKDGVVGIVAIDGKKYETEGTLEKSGKPA